MQLAGFGKAVFDVWCTVVGQPVRIASSRPIHLRGRQRAGSLLSKAKGKRQKAKGKRHKAQGTSGPRAWRYGAPRARARRRAQASG
jgi:hypothetical protein